MASVQLGPSQFERSPGKDAEQIVEALKANGTIDTVHKKVIDSLRHNEKFRAGVQQLMIEKGLLQEGKAYESGERGKVAHSFIRGDQEKQLLDLARDAIWDILAGASDPQGLAAQNKQLVHQALVTMLEQEELERQAQFQQLHQKHLSGQQQQQQQRRYRWPNDQHRQQQQQQQQWPQLQQQLWQQQQSQQQQRQGQQQQQPPYGQQQQ